MSTAISRGNGIRDLADLYQFIDALARGECTEQEFLIETRRLLESETELSWDVLAYLDQQYRRGHLVEETFQSIKRRIAWRAVRKRDSADDYRDGETVELYPPRPPAVPSSAPSAAAVSPAPSAAELSPAPPDAVSSEPSVAVGATPFVAVTAAVLSAAPVPPAAIARALTAAPTPLAPAAILGEHMREEKTEVECPGVAALEVGCTLRNRYRVKALLGRGGMGDVYEAIDFAGNGSAQSEVRVAIKVLREGSDQRPEASARLQGEFECLRKLSHPNVVKVYEFDCAHGRAFYTMELLEGERVEDLLTRASGVSLPRAYAWALIGAVGAALAHAHARNVVHGDLSPKNIMITSGGEVRVLDFGSSTMSNGIAVPAEFDSAGVVAATPAYASCDVLEGERADPRDDLYALACIAYELLAGRRPFPGKRATEARDAGIRPPRPLGLNFNQWRTLELGLSWTRDERSISVRQWLARLGLEPEAERLPPLTGFESRSRRATGPRSAMAALLIAAIGAAILAWQSFYAGPRSPDPGSRGSMPIAAQIVREAPMNNGPTPSAPSTAHADRTPAAPLPIEIPEVPATVSVLQIDPAAPAPVLIAPAAPSASMRKPAHGTPPAVPRPAFGFTAHRYLAGRGAHFVETRVWRTYAWNDSSGFVWWTNDSSAKAGIDFVGQAPTPHKFARGSQHASLFVRLLPNSRRAQSSNFRVCLGKPGGAAGLTNVTCSSIFLPGADDRTT